MWSGSGRTSIAMHWYRYGVNSAAIHAWPRCVPWRHGFAESIFAQYHASTISLPTVLPGRQCSDGPDALQRQAAGVDAPEIPVELTSASFLLDVYERISLQQRTAEQCNAAVIADSFDADDVVGILERYPQ